MCKYKCVHSDMLTHTYMYKYIYIYPKKLWQSGSTEKYSVEALSAWSPLSRAVVA